MLFDLRGRGRRRIVRVIYASLALLMGGGLVLFGVGGATSGGLLDAFKSNNGTTSTPLYKKQIDLNQRAVKLNPRNVEAWDNLAKYLFQDASAAGYDQNTATFTDNGKQRLAKAEAAWNRYIALKPKTVDPTTALYMVQAFSPSALAKPDAAVAAMEYVLAGRKQSPGLYLQYAQLAYAAGQTRKGELAGAKAVSLAPKDSRAALQASLDQLKSAAAQQQTTTATVPPTTSSPAATTTSKAAPKKK